MKKPIKSTFPQRVQKVEKAEFIFGSAEVTGPIPVSSFLEPLILQDSTEPTKANLVGFYFAWNSAMLLIIWLFVPILCLFLW